MRNILSEFLKKLINAKIPSLHPTLLVARTGINVSTVQVPSSSEIPKPVNGINNVPVTVKNIPENVPQNVPNVLPFILPKNVLLDSLALNNAQDNAERYHKLLYFIYFSFLNFFVPLVFKPFLSFFIFLNFLLGFYRCPIALPLFFLYIFFISLFLSLPQSLSLLFTVFVN